MNFFEMIAAVFGGSLFGSFLGPLLLDKIQKRSHRKDWEEPRIALLKALFSEVDMPVISVSDLAIRCGCDQRQTRDLLVKIGAFGTMMSNGEEGWCLDKGRLKFHPINIDRPQSS